MENIGICKPLPGYLESVREITQRYGTLFIFDEVKTGITAGWSGATGALGVLPDLVALAKSIGGGLALGRVWRQARVHGSDHAGSRTTPGHLQRQPAVHGCCQGGARRRSALRRNTLGCIDRNRSACSKACDEIIPPHALTAHTVQFGAKGCITWAAEPIRNYRDYKATNFDLAFAQWIHGINRGILLPPGLDEQWLISVMHTQTPTRLRYAQGVRRIR